MNGVPSRNEWTTRIPAGGKEIAVELHTVFGWKVHRHLMPVGSVLLTNSIAEVPRNRAPNRAMYVSGRCTVENDGIALDDRLPGLYTGERPCHPAGVTKVTAVEPSEFWCFNYFMNRKALPVLTPVRAAAGSLLQITTGQLLFIMKGRAGDLVGPMTLCAEQDMQIEVEEDLFAFLFANEKT